MKSNDIVINMAIFQLAYEDNQSIKGVSQFVVLLDSFKKTNE
jgi:hypothetical protein